MLRFGDCVKEMRLLAAEGMQVQSVVTDPPYHLTQVSRGGSPRQFVDNPYGRSRVGTDRGFMGQTWDGGDVAFRPETWRAAFDLLPPGGHLVAFSGTRTYHRMAVAIEDAGFEIRDQLAWVYGQGFPKSHNLEGEWEGWGTALKPAWEPICLARKPLAGTVAQNVLAHGVGALNVDGCRIPFVSDADKAAAFPGGKLTSHGAGALAGPGIAQDAERSDFLTKQNTNGRWPANIVHDGSAEVVAMFPTAPGQLAKASTDTTARKTQNVYGVMARGSDGQEPRGDTGSAARFFYCTKATKADRAGSKHPTVKPVALMRWLCRLVTPPGGTVLDPFMGSGTTLQAAREEGFNWIGIDRDVQWFQDACARMGADPISMLCGE